MNRGFLRRDRADSSVESVLLLPVLLTVALILVQIAANIHASHVAAVTAMRGAQVASRSEQRSDSVVDALREMESTMRDLQGRSAESISVDFDGSVVRTTVILRAGGVLPWLAGRIERSATVPLEQFTFSGRR